MRATRHACLFAVLAEPVPERIDRRKGPAESCRQDRHLLLVSSRVDGNAQRFEQRDDDLGLGLERPIFDDAFPDVLKGMITAEEAQDYPEEAKPRQMARPANPLDMVAPTPMIEQTSNPAVIEEVFAKDQEVDAVNELVAQAMAEAMEVVDIPEVVEAPATVATEGFAVLLPGKDKPLSTHATIEEWQDAYEDVADKTARAGKVLPRDRMTKLKELREANEPTLAKVEMLKRIRHTAAYSKRLGALGAAQ